MAKEVGTRKLYLCSVRLRGGSCLDKARRKENTIPMRARSISISGEEALKTSLRMSKKKKTSMPGGREGVEMVKAVQRTKKRKSCTEDILQIQLRDEKRG